MKSIKLFQFLVFTSTILIYGNNGMDQDIIIGEVVHVKHNIVQIKTSKIKKVKIGNHVNLYYKTAFGDKIKFGEWIVSNINYKSIKAEPIYIISKPSVGLLAEITKPSKKEKINPKRNQIYPWSKNSHTNNSMISTEPITLLGEIFDPKLSTTSKKYVDKAKQITDDLYKKSKKYSKNEKKILWNKVIKNIQKAISMDNAEAYYLLALIYEDGYGDIKRDLKGMTDNLIISAKKGYKEAQFLIGYMYATGNEVVKDREKGMYWLKKAADQGHKDAKDELNILMKNTVKKQPSNNDNINDLYDLLD